MANSITLADFHDIQLSIIDHVGKKWLNAEQCGLALGYAQTNASSGIRTIYNRHTDEFSEADARRVNLTRRDGKTSEQLIFSDTGCIKLGFFANTPRAKEFRNWASRALAAQAVAATVAPVDLQASLDTLTRHMGTLAQGMETLLRQEKRNERYIGLLEINQKGHIKITREVEAQVLELSGQGMPQASIARLLRISASTVNQLIHGKYIFSPRAGAAPVDQVQATIENMIQIEQAAREGSAA